MHCGLRYTKKLTGSEFFFSSNIKKVYLALKLFSRPGILKTKIKYLFVLSTIKQNLRYSPEKHCISGLGLVPLLNHSAVTVGVGAVEGTPPSAGGQGGQWPG